MTSDKLRNVLVGIDFSEFSCHALRIASRLGLADAARVHVIHVIERLVVADLSRALRATEPEIEREVIDTARQHLREFIERTCQPDTIFKAEVVIGNPFAEILARVNDLSADLLVIGSNGWSDPKRGAGILATRCVRKAPTQVLLVRRHQNTKFRRVVACVDWSETSLRAVQKAIWIARADNAELHVLHVFFPPWRVLHYRAPTPEASPNFQHQYFDAVEGHMRRFLAPVERDLEQLGAKTAFFEHSNHGLGIVDYLNSVEADLAVLGTRGRSGAIRVFLMGTTAERVIREAPCSVLGIKPEPEDTA